MSSLITAQSLKNDVNFLEKRVDQYKRKEIDVCKLRGVIARIKRTVDSLETQDNIDALEPEVLIKFMDLCKEIVDERLIFTLKYFESYIERYSKSDASKEFDVDLDNKFRYLGKLVEENDGLVSEDIAKKCQDVWAWYQHVYFVEAARIHLHKVTAKNPNFWKQF
jgi:hypothetical protein